MASPCCLNVVLACPPSARSALPTIACCPAAESLDRNHLTFTTIRPADYPTPYEAMLKHNIQV